MKPQNRSLYYCSKYLQALMTLLSLTLSSCVSVKLSGGSGAAKKSDHVNFSPPPAPFLEMKETMGDKSWVNPLTGHIISYLSECNSADPELKVLETESLSVLENPQVLISESIDFNQRKAIKTKALGHVDGIPVFLNLVIFKKNNCAYTLSCTGKKRSPKDQDAQEIQEFKNFVDSFRVQ